MGRIQRKKPAGSKKKKKQKADRQAAAGLQPVQVRAVKKASTSEAAIKGNKKKLSLLPSKQPSAASPLAAKAKDNIFNKTA